MRTVVGHLRLASRGAVERLVLPGIGPVVVAGMLAAGIAGAAGGGLAGRALEEHLTAGVPREQLIAVQAALRERRTVALAFAESDAEAEAARQAFTAAGAEPG
jgi:hypothetical protein